MDDSKILEVNLQIEQLKKSNPEVYGWIMLKEKYVFLQEELKSDDPERNNEENQQEFEHTSKSIIAMKNQYSSVKLYEALIHLKKSILAVKTDPKNEK